MNIIEHIDKETQYELCNNDRNVRDMGHIVKKNSFIVRTKNGGDE